MSIDLKGGFSNRLYFNSGKVDLNIILFDVVSFWCDNCYENKFLAKMIALLFELQYFLFRFFYEILHNYRSIETTKRKTETFRVPDDAGSIILRLRAYNVIDVAIFSARCKNNVDIRLSKTKISITRE